MRSPYQNGPAVPFDPDPYQAPPHVWFSGVGVTFVLDLAEFIGGRAFCLKVSEPGTAFFELGVLDHPFDE